MLLASWSKIIVEMHDFDRDPLQLFSCFESKHVSMVIWSNMTLEMNNAKKILFNCAPFPKAKKILLISSSKILVKVNSSEYDSVQLFCSQRKNHFTVVDVTEDFIAIDLFAVLRCSNVLLSDDRIYVVD